MKQNTCAGWLPQEGQLHWQEQLVSPLNAHEVLLHIKAAGVNRADLLQLKGKYPPPLGASPILGLEVSGEVQAVGPGVSRVKVGDRVMALLDGGGYGTHVVAHESLCLRMPDDLNWPEAAALMEGAFTWQNSVAPALNRPCKNILIHAGAGGIGTLFIQFAKAQGLEVLVTVSSQEKAELCHQLGADEVIILGPTNRLSFPRRRESLEGSPSGSQFCHPGPRSGISQDHKILGQARDDSKMDPRLRGDDSESARDDSRRGDEIPGQARDDKESRDDKELIDIIVDCIGGETLAQNIACLAPGGWLVQIGAMAGAKASLPLVPLMKKGLIVTGATLRDKPLAHKIKLAQQVEEWLPALLASGQVKPVVHQVFPMAQAPQALALMEAGGYAGKLVLEG
jgi:NADPH:quinone reductase-like Zn-dependent oxidoreductase